MEIDFSSVETKYGGDVFVHAAKIGDLKLAEKCYELEFEFDDRFFITICEYNRAEFIDHFRTHFKRPFTPLKTHFKWPFAPYYICLKTCIIKDNEECFTKIYDRYRKQDLYEHLLKMTVDNNSTKCFISMFNNINFHMMKDCIYFNDMLDTSYGNSNLEIFSRLMINTYNRCDTVNKITDKYFKLAIIGDEDKENIASWMGFTYYLNDPEFLSYMILNDKKIYLNTWLKKETVIVTDTFTECIFTNKSFSIEALKLIKELKIVFGWKKLFNYLIEGISSLENDCDKDIKYFDIIVWMKKNVKSELE